MAAATLASSVVVRGTPVASVAAGKRASARPMRGSALVVRAEGEIAGLSECGKFQELCKAEIPGKIPRHDFLLQMYRYMEIAYGDNGLAQYGKRMEVELLSNGKEGDEELTNGMLVVIFGNKDGEEVEICELICEMDDEQVPTFDTLMPSQDGELMKTNRSGKDEFVTGKYFVIKRPVPIDESANPALKQMIKDMTLAINKYYAFGSCFSDDN